MIDAEPGDFILAHRPGLSSRIIRLGERVRFRRGAAWSHAALVVDNEQVIEALTRGVVRTPLSHYEHIEHRVVHTHMSPIDAYQAVTFAESCVGQRYGWPTILGVALRFLTPGRGLWLGMDGTEICSGLVAQALVRGWPIFKSNPASMTPAELAEEYPEEI